MFEEKSLPKNMWKNLPNISTETFPAKRLERGISAKNFCKHFCQSLFEESLPKTLWKEIYAKQIPAETSTKKEMEEPFLPQNLLREISTKQCSKETPTKKYLRKKSTPRKKNLCQTIFEDQIRPKYIYIYVWRKIRYQTICEGRLSTKQALNRNIFQTNFKGNL